MIGIHLIKELAAIWTIYGIWSVANRKCLYPYILGSLDRQQKRPETLIRSCIIDDGVPSEYIGGLLWQIVYIYLLDGKSPLPHSLPNRSNEGKGAGNRVAIFLQSIERDKSLIRMAIRLSRLDSGHHYRWSMGAAYCIGSRAHLIQQSTALTDQMTEIRWDGT